MEEMLRGTPVVYVDYTDYDEIAHHSGPERSEALDALEGVDRTIGSLVKAAADAPRPYRFVLLSDHGQSLGATFRQRYGKTLQEVIAERMGGGIATRAATEASEPWGPLNAALAEARQTTGPGGAITRAVTPRAEAGLVEFGPRGAGHAAPAPTPATRAVGDEVPELVVCASGNLALIYFPRLPGRVTLETMEATWPGLVGELGRHPGVGLLMVRSEVHGTIVFGAGGAHYLDADRVDGDDPIAPYGEHAAMGLLRVSRMEHCGDLVAISVLDPTTDEVAAFEELIGSHGGLGGAQTQPFILHPAAWPIHEPLVGAESVYGQLRQWLSGIGIELGAQDAAAPAPGRTPAPAPEIAAVPGQTGDASGLGVPTT
jgi:hypothetical protein